MTGGCTAIAMGLRRAGKLFARNWPQPKHSMEKGLLWQAQL